MDKTAREYVVCPCRKVTRGEIEDIVREKRIDNLKDLCEAANAGNKCGGCREMLEQIMNEVLEAME